MTGLEEGNRGMRKLLGAAMLLAVVGAPATMLPPEAGAQAPPTRADEQAPERAQVLLGNRQLGVLRGLGVQPGIGIGIADAEDRPGAVRVLSVTPRSGAEDGGLRVGDLLVALDGTRLDARGDETPTEALIRQVRQRETGDTVRIRVIRDGREEERAIEIRPLPGIRIQATGASRDPASRRTPVVEVLRGSLAEAVDGTRRLALSIGTAGLHATNLNEGLSGYFGRGDGALILEAGDRAPEGLRAGDVVIGIDGREVGDAADLRRILASYRPGENLTFRVWREGREVEVATVTAG